MGGRWAKERLFFQADQGIKQSFHISSQFAAKLAVFRMTKKDSKMFEPY